MRTLHLELPPLLILIIGLFASQKTFPGNADSIVFENDSVFTIQSVQEELSNDGEWIKVNKEEIDPEGVTDGSDVDDNLNTEYVWRPYGVGPDWTPYTNGYWVYTNCGWMWISYYTWGWRTCHYGRWWYSPVWGWVWSPGYVWAPAWVVWIFFDGYCGWYPVSPRVRWHHQHHRWYCHNMRFHTRHWTYCHTNNFNGPIKPEVIVDPPPNKEISKKGKVYAKINIEKNIVVCEGPDINDIEKYGGKKVKKENVTKYNNVKIVTVKEKNTDGTKVEEKVKYNEKQNTGEKQKTQEKEKWTKEKQSNDSEKKNDQGNKNNESKEKQKSNDNEKVKQPEPKGEKKYEQPKQYDPPKEKKKQEYYTPPKDDSKTSDNNKSNNNNGKNDAPVNKDKGSGKDNNNEQKSEKKK